MTKAQIVKELRAKGHCWANESYPKAQLEQYLNDLHAAEKMTAEELLAAIRTRVTSK